MQAGVLTFFFHMKGGSHNPMPAHPHAVGVVANTHLVAAVNSGPARAHEDNGHHHNKRAEGGMDI